MFNTFAQPTPEERIENLHRRQKKMGEEIDRLEGEVRERDLTASFLAGELRQARHSLGILDRGLGESYANEQTLREELRDSKEAAARLFSRVEAATADARYWERRFNEQIDAGARFAPEWQRLALNEMLNHRLEFEHPVVHKISVIKEVRERFGTGLKVAKNIVDHWCQLDQNEAMIAQAEDDGWNGPDGDEQFGVPLPTEDRPDDPSIDDTRPDEAIALDREAGL